MRRRADRQDAGHDARRAITLFERRDVEGIAAGPVEARPQRGRVAAEAHAHDPEPGDVEGPAQIRRELAQIPDRLAECLVRPNDVRAGKQRAGARRPGGRALVIEDIPTTSKLNVVGHMIHWAENGHYIRPADDYRSLLRPFFRVEDEGQFRSGVCDYYMARVVADPGGKVDPAPAGGGAPEPSVAS